MAGHGFNGFLGIGPESTWGSAVTVTDYFEAFSESVTETYDRFQLANIIGRLAEPDDYAGILRVSGDISCAAHPHTLGFFLRGVTGVLSSSMTDGLGTHIFTMGTATHQGSYNALHPFTFEINRDLSSSHQYDGAQISQVTLNGAPNQDLRVTASVLAKGRSIIAKTTPSYTSSSTFPFTFETCSVQIAGAANVDLESFTFTINNQVEGIATLNNDTEVQKMLRSGNPQIRLSGQMQFEDLDDYDRFINQTEIAMSFNFTRADSFSMLIDIPRFVYTSYPVNMGGADRVSVGFEGMCRYHTGSGQAFEITLTNVTSSDVYTG